MTTQVEQVEQTLETLKARFDPEAAGSTKATIQFTVSDIPNGTWVLRINEGQCSLERGRVRDPDAGLKAKADDLVKFFSGEISQTIAVISKKVEVLGSMATLGRMEKWFKM